MTRRPRTIAAARQGTTTVEFAIISSALIMIVCFTIDLGLFIFSQSAVQFAAERAARCAALNTTKCGNTANVQNYALTQALGAPNVKATDFTVTTPACGYLVTVNKGPFPFIFYGIGPPATLRASSCFPK